LAQHSAQHLAPSHITSHPTQSQYATPP
jgi:hypothetical protein